MPRPGLTRIPLPETTGVKQPERLIALRLGDHGRAGYRAV
jgi:hypothetical protein